MRPAILPFLGGFLAAFLLGAAVVPSSVSAGAPASAPDRGDLRLEIVDGLTGEPVPFANLIRTRPAAGYVAGPDGVVSLRNVDAGTWTVRVVHAEYRETPPLRLEVPAGGGLAETVSLTPLSHAMDVIEVRGDAHQAARRAATGVRTVFSSDVRSLPNPSDDVFQMVRLLPGVSSDETGAEFHIRGGDTDETLVLVDGLEIRQLFHGRDYGGITSVVPFSMVDGVDVFPGACPAIPRGRATSTGCSAASAAGSTRSPATGISSFAP